MADLIRGRSQLYPGRSQFSQRLGQGVSNKLRPTNQFYSLAPAAKTAVSPMLLVVVVTTLLAVIAVTVGVAVYFSTKSDGVEALNATTPLSVDTDLSTESGVTQVTSDTSHTDDSVTLASVADTSGQSESTVEASETTASVANTQSDATTDGETMDDTTTESQDTTATTEESMTSSQDTTSEATTTEDYTTTGEKVETTTEEVITTTKPDVLGNWSNWTEWGSCDVTCGGGLQRRSRDCEGGQEGFYCLGTASESQRCNTETCPFVVTAGSWFVWSSWTSCSVSCGGGAQIRSRSCDRGDLDLDCIGDSQQTQECSPWTCPDCSRNCDTGTLTGGCTHCECSEQVDGVVRSEAGVALGDVQIYRSDLPYIVLHTTPPNGTFFLDKLCNDQTLTFQKTGYTTVTHNVGAVPGEVQLKENQMLVMDIQPTSKKRIVGDDVLFCCEASGNPSPQYYEWFKNDVELPGETNNTLLLTSITLDSAATYSCRASTDSSGVRSTDAVLTVKENPDDFCPSSPSIKYQKLPNGCSYNGEIVIDVGACDNVRCRGNTNTTASCSDESMSCCATTQYETESIVCSSFTYTVYKAMACGCAECTSPVIDIQGFVFSADDNSPLSNVQIYYNNTQVATTVANGQFYFTVPEGTRTISVTAQSPMRSQYADTTAVLQLEEDANGVYYLSLKLPPVNQLADIDSTADQTVAITTEAGTTLVDISIPADSFYDEDGNLYQGTVTSYASVIDPTDVKQLESAPGDFTTIGPNGDSEQLQTYGMMQLSFYTDDGSKLQIMNEVQLDIPASVLGDVDVNDGVDSSNSLSAIKLYVFNTQSGRWEELASIQGVSKRRRKKRQYSSYTVTIAGITSSQPWFNFDAVSTTTCISKIRIYENENFLERDQIRPVSVYAFIQGNDNTYSYSRRVVYNNNDNKGYCLVHRCDSPRNGNSPLGFKGFLVAEKDGKYLIPAVNDTGLDDLVEVLNYTALEDKIHVNYNLSAVNDSMGPFYDWDGKWIYSPKCIDAPISHRHFRFNLHKEDQCYNFEGLQFRDTLTDTCQPQFYKSWHDASEYSAQEYTTCYIRVKIAQYTDDVKVQALSQVGTMQYNSSLDTIEPLDIYGYHENCTVGGVVCSKIKPPGTRTCSLDSLHNLEDLYTYVSITAWYKGTDQHLNSSVVNTDFNNTFTISEFGPTFAFQLPSSGTVGGVFCETRTGSSPTESDIAAFSSCMEAEDEEFAVQFGTSVDCFGEIILLLNQFAKVNSEGTFQDWLLELAEYLPIGQDNVRVSLTLVNNERNTLWNLTSQFTSSNEMLHNALMTFPGNESLNGSVYLSNSNGTVNTILQEARDDVKIIVIALDYEWTASQFNTSALNQEVEYLQVVPYGNQEERFFENNSTEVDPRLFDLTRNTTAQFLGTIGSILGCNLPPFQQTLPVA